LSRNSRQTVWGKCTLTIEIAKANGLEIRQNHRLQTSQREKAQKVNERGHKGRAAQGGGTHGTGWVQTRRKQTNKGEEAKRKIGRSKHKRTKKRAR